MGFSWIGHQARKFGLYWKDEGTVCPPTNRRGKLRAASVADSLSNCNGSLNFRKVRKCGGFDRTPLALFVNFRQRLSNLPETSYGSPPETPFPQFGALAGRSSGEP
jgi:hypothetical protein